MIVPFIVFVTKKPALFAINQITLFMFRRYEVQFDVFNEFSFTALF